MSPSPRPVPPAQEGPVPSPCIDVCRMNPASGLCEGCLRTIDEIAAWSQMRDDDKRVVWTALERRRIALSVAAAGPGPAPGRAAPAPRREGP